jgi:hypothetical protein
LFSAAYDARANILRISVEGVYSMSDVPAFAASIDGTARRASAIRGDFDVLVESFDFPVQADDVANAMTDIMRGGMALTSGHAAIVVASEANREQVERTLVHPRLRAFMTLRAALEWLTSNASPPLG